MKSGMRLPGEGELVFESGFLQHEPRSPDTANVVRDCPSLHWVHLQPWQHPQQSGGQVQALGGHLHCPPPHCADRDVGSGLPPGYGWDGGMASSYELKFGCRPEGPSGCVEIDTCLSHSSNSCDCDGSEDKSMLGGGMPAGRDSMVQSRQKAQEVGLVHVANVAAPVIDGLLCIVHPGHMHESPQAQTDGKASVGAQTSGTG